MEFLKAIINFVYNYCWNHTPGFALSTHLFGESGLIKTLSSLIFKLNALRYDG